MIADERVASAEPTGSSLRLDGQAAVITGAAHGIGRETALLLGRRGASILICDRDGPGAKSAAKGLVEVGIDAVAQEVDVTAYTEVERAVGEALTCWGRIDILVNSAGIGGFTAPVWELELTDWNSVLNVNLNGVFHFCRAVVPTMISQGSGHIVSIASIAGKEGNPTSAHYSASKAALIALTKCLGKELARTGVVAHAIAPAVIRTGILDRPGVKDGFLESLVEKIPMGRLGTPDEVARLVGFLVSNELTFSTGATFDLSGGRATY